MKICINVPFRSLPQHKLFNFLNNQVFLAHQLGLKIKLNSAENLAVNINSNNN